MQKSFVREVLFTVLNHGRLGRRMDFFSSSCKQKLTATFFLNTKETKTDRIIFSLLLEEIQGLMV